MGIYGIRRSLIKNIPVKKYIDFPALIKEQLKTGTKLGVYKFTGRWYDIGRIDDYQMAQSDFKENSNNYLCSRQKGDE
jgi:NDP-sugar pyrophosphorylase family protein